MLDSSLISVIVPAYNHEKYIDECICSIVNQTYKQLELIVSDDGSSDSTYDKLIQLQLKYGSRFKRFEILHHKNVGLIKSLNMLLKKSFGEFVFVMASDDVVKPDAVERLYDFLSNNDDYILAVGDNEIIDEQSRRIYWDRFRESVDSKKAVFKTLGQSLGSEKACKNNTFGTYKELLKHNHITNGYLIRFAAIREIGGYNDLFPEDWNLHLQLSKHGKFKFINDILFSYRWHNDNTVKKFEYYLISRRDRRKQLKNEFTWCEKQGLVELWKDCWRREFGFFGTLNYFRKNIIQINYSQRKIVFKLFRKTLYRWG